MTGVANMGVCPITIVIVGAITAHHFVGVDLALAGSGDNCYGVAAYDGTDEATTVDTLGIVYVEAGAAVAANALVQSDASGRAITKAAGATVGRALDAATQAGDLIRVVLIPN